MVQVGDQGEKTPKSHAKANSNGNWKMNLNRQLRNTRLCTYFQQTGSCKYGARCGFAHQESDLQKSPDLAKTRMCPNQGTCEDVNCPFAHTGEELRSTDFYFKTSLCTWYGAGKCRNGPSCRFAHGEEELRSVAGGDEVSPQQSKTGKADKVEKKAKNAANKQDTKQNITEKQPKAQKSEKAKKSKAAKVEPQFLGAPGAPEVGNFAVPPQQAPQQPMFIQPRQLEPCMLSQPASGFTTLPPISPLEHLATPMPALDYHGLSQFLSGYHCNNVASMVDAQQQAVLSQLGQIPGLTTPKSASTYAGLDFNYGLSHNYPVPPGLGQNAVSNDSTSWEISALSEHIRTLGEQVSKLQQSISLNPQNPQAMKGSYDSETTKSGSGGSGSQGSGSSGDRESPPGSPPDGRHPEELNAEAAQLSFALQRFIAAQR